MAPCALYSVCVDACTLFNEASGVVNGEIRGLLEKYPTFGREKDTGLLGALDNLSPSK